MSATNQYLDKEGLLHVWQKIKLLLGDKVDKVSGKSLISDAEITRLANVTNYDDTEVQSLLSTLSDKVTALEQGAYDDTQLRKYISDTYATLSALSEHTGNTTIHITSTERTTWNGKQDKLTIDTIVSNSSTNPVSSKAVADALGNKVDAVTGKGLSTNDYTTTDKNKLTGIATGAEVNVINSVKVNGSALTITSKAVDITVPTNNNQLTNGAGYQTASDVESTITGKGYQTSAQVESAITGKGYQTASQVQAAIGDVIKDITGFERQILTTGQYNASGIPTVAGANGVIYMVPKSLTEGNNYYTEFMWTGTAFEQIGDTKVDISNCVTYDDIGDLKEDLNNLSGDISQLSESVTEISDVVFTKSMIDKKEEIPSSDYLISADGYRFALDTELKKIYAEKSSLSGRYVRKISVKAGAKYSFICFTDGYSGDTPSSYNYAYAITDDDKNVITLYTNHINSVFAKTEDITVTIPSGGAYLYINNKTGNDQTVYRYVDKKPNIYTKEETFNRGESDNRYVRKTEYIPKMLINFDAPTAFVTDGRFDLCKKYKLPFTVNVTINSTGTIGYPDSQYGHNYIDEILSYGGDIALYSALDKPSEDADVYNGGTEAVTIFEEYIQKALDKAEAIGIFHPFAWFSRFQRTGTAMNQALINKGFKICRGYKYGTQESTELFIDHTKFKNNDAQLFNVSGGYEIGEDSTVDVMKTKIDKAIETGKDFSVFCHKICAEGETPRQSVGTTHKNLESVLAYIRDKIDLGLCEAVTFRDYYSNLYPSDGAERNIGNLYARMNFKINS